MKQSAFVIATLFSAVAADATTTANHNDAKQRMENDIKGYLSNGHKFENRVIKAAQQNAKRQKALRNDFKNEVRENIKTGHVVADEYKAAYEYEKSQITVTKPSAANNQWGSISVSNPQKVMDNYVAAYKHDRALGNEWKEDIQEYGQKSHASNEIAHKQVEAAWNQNGKQAVGFAESAIENAQDAMRPHSLAAATATTTQDAIRSDVKNFVDSVGDAAQAVRHTAEVQHKLDAPMNRNIDQATRAFMKKKMAINKGYAEAVKFEIKNTHFDAGKTGGEGHLNWTNKQQIVNHWKSPIVADRKAREQWMNTVKRNMEEKRKVHQMVKAEAKKVWPAKFQAVENSWNELAENFDQEHSLLSRAEIQADRELAKEEMEHSLVSRAEIQADRELAKEEMEHSLLSRAEIQADRELAKEEMEHSLASRAAIKDGLDNMAHAGANLDKAVLDDFVEFHNDTASQRNTFKGEVKTFMEQQEKIHQAYETAWDYEMDNIHFNNNNGQWSYTVDNENTIIDNWTDAQADDIASRQELKADFINYQKSIAAEKAKFRATAKATWPKAFNAYKASVQGFMQTMQQPQSLVSDADQAMDMKIRNQVYEQLNEREQFKWEVKKDLKAYLNNTAGARNNLKSEVAQWKAGSKRVSDMYAAAWNYQVAQTKFTAADASHPATFELENAQAVSNNWRNATQADQDLGNRMAGDVKNFFNQTQPARATLKNEIQTQWAPAADRIHEGDVQIIDEVFNYHAAHFNQTHFNQTHFNQTHNLFAVESSSTMTMDEQLAYGSVFLCAMIAVAALSNKGKAESKTVEFDVEDLEMTNKKESKKAIKKTLKQIMKTSNTKVAIMKN